MVKNSEPYCILLNHSLDYLHAYFYSYGSKTLFIKSWFFSDRIGHKNITTSIRILLKSYSKIFYSFRFDKKNRMKPTFFDYNENNVSSDSCLQIMTNIFHHLNPYNIAKILFVFFKSSTKKSYFFFGF